MDSIKQQANLLANNILDKAKMLHLQKNDENLDNLRNQLKSFAVNLAVETALAEGKNSAIENLVASEKETQSLGGQIKAKLNEAKTKSE